MVTRLKYGVLQLFPNKIVCVVKYNLSLFADSKIVNPYNLQNVSVGHILSYSAYKILEHIYTIFILIKYV